MLHGKVSDERMSEAGNRCDEVDKLADNAGNGCSKMGSRVQQSGLTYTTKWATVYNKVDGQGL